jgi:hypothetical protein
MTNRIPSGLSDFMGGLSFILPAEEPLGSETLRVSKSSDRTQSEATRRHVIVPPEKHAAGPRRRAWPGIGIVSLAADEDGDYTVGLY